MWKKIDSNGEETILAVDKNVYYAKDKRMSVEVVHKVKTQTSKNYQFGTSPVQCHLACQERRVTPNRLGIYHLTILYTVVNIIP